MAAERPISLRPKATSTRWVCRPQDLLFPTAEHHIERTQNRLSRHQALELELIAAQLCTQPGGVAAQQTGQDRTATGRGSSAIACHCRSPARQPAVLQPARPLLPAAAEDVKEWPSGPARRPSLLPAGGTAVSRVGLQIMARTLHISQLKLHTSMQVATSSAPAAVSDAAPAFALQHQ